MIRFFPWRFGALALFSILASLCSAQAGGYSVLYRFEGGSDGAIPETTLIKDRVGNLYGTTEFGGDGSGTACDDGCGTIFELGLDGEKTVLHSLDGGSEGAIPIGNLNLDGGGNLYGVAEFGGQTGGNCGSSGCGSVFRLAPDGTFDALHEFAGKPDGANGLDGLLKGAKGAHYGATFGGGIGVGVVYKITKDGTETVLHSFQSGGDGDLPIGNLIQDRAGNLYGTTFEGGSVNEAGAIYKLAPDGTETILHSFSVLSDGAGPESGLVRDAAGNLYGTASYGGGNADAGTIFKLAPDGTYTVLYRFSGQADGNEPQGIVLGPKGNILGVTWQGGNFNCDSGHKGCGIVFELNPNGILAVLHTFSGGDDGANPTGILLKGTGGDFYGTTDYGGAGACANGNFSGCGTVFKVHQFR